MRSIPELYERSLSLLSDGDLLFVLTDCLSPQELVKLINKFAEPPPGFRPESIPLVDTALDALDFYMDDPGAGHLMISSLNKKTAALTRDIGNIEAKDLRKRFPPRIIRGMIEDFTVGRLLWALLRDERPEAEALLKKVKSQLQKESGKKASKKSPAKSRGSKPGKSAPVPPADEDFEERVKKSKEFLDDLANEYRSVFHQVKRSQEKEKKSREKMKTARRELQEVLRERKLLSEKCRGLEDRIRSLEARPAPAAGDGKKLKRALKEKEKLEYEVAKLKEAGEIGKRELTALEQKWRNLVSERDGLMGAVGNAKERESALLKKIGELERELDSLKARARAASKKDRPEKREYWKQRIGVFVDGFSCFRSARALYGRKIDYRSLLEKVLDMRIRSISVVYLPASDFARLDNLRQFLVSLGLTVKPMKINWENEAIRDIMNHSDRLDTIVTCTGNTPSRQFLEAVGKTGKRIEIHCFEREGAGERASIGSAAGDEISRLGEEVLLPA